MVKQLKIFALGGNEISPAGTIDPSTGKLILPGLAEQWKKTSTTCELLAKIIQKHPDDYYILTHGNGPQVGSLLMNTNNLDSFFELDVCDADTQGSMGYMLSQLTNSLRILGINKVAAETVTKVVVEENDPAFQFPSKFIGYSYTKEDGLEIQQKESRPFKFYKKDEEGNELWRWIVASPNPIDIVEIELIEANLKAGIIPISVGGGGIPVVKVKPEIVNDEEVYKCKFGINYKRKFVETNLPVNIYSGINAVVDKDIASSLLGTMLLKRAKERGDNLYAELFIFTDVDGVKLNYQEPDQIDVRHLSLNEARKLYGENVFPAGSMGPKIKAAINFIEGGGKKVFITKAELYEETLSGNGGTVIEEN
ncbi:MAG: amino acid kinase family protein [Ignavibacteriaceae bacterium]